MSLLQMSRMKARAWCLMFGHTDPIWVRNIYGDEINAVSTIRRVYRSWWMCRDCLTWFPKESLQAASRSEGVEP